MFSYTNAELPDEAACQTLMEALTQDQAQPVNDLAQRAGLNSRDAMLALAWLAKVGCIVFAPAQSEA